MSSFGPSSLLGCALAIGVASTACDSCRRDRPFTPFRDAAATAVEQTLTPPPLAVSVGDNFLQAGERLPPNSQHFLLGARQADAPVPMTFDSVLRVDWNEDGKIDGLALLRSSQGEAPPVGAVYLYDGGGDARKLLDLPGWIPSSQDCTWDSQLLRVGRHTATVDVHVHCGIPMPPRASTRFLAVVSPTRAEPTIISWRLADPAPDEAYDVTVSGTDRDGDNTDDVTLSLSLGLASSKTRVHAEFAWLDRAAGVSREPAHFATSLGENLAVLEKKAASRASAADAVSGAGLVWRLMSNACAESATPRIFASNGSPLTCENAGVIATRLTGLEVRAALSQNDVLKAAFALTKGQSALGSSLSAPERLRLVKSIRQACTDLSDISTTASDIRPSLPRVALHFSPLQFQSDGILLAETSHGIVRVQSDGRESPAEDDAAAPPNWPLAVTSTDGRTWESVIPSCDRSEIQVITKGTSGNLLTPQLTDLLAPRPGLCAGETTLHWRVSPIHFEEGKMPVALVEGACLTSDASISCLKPSQLGTPQPGSPLSPDGHTLVAMTGIGLFVVGKPKPELWEGPALSNPGALSDCVVANGGERVACLNGARLWLFAKSPTPRSEVP